MFTKAVRLVLRDKSRAATERRLFLSPVSFVTRQKKSAKPGKGRETPFDARPTLGHLVGLAPSWRTG